MTFVLIPSQLSYHAIPRFNTTVMASALEAVLEDMMQCVICNDEYNETDRVAKNLPCGHTLCLQCATQVMQRSDHDQTLRCPECRLLHTIIGGAMSLPTNVMVARTITAKQEVAFKTKVQEMKGELQTNIAVLEIQIAECDRHIQQASKNCKNVVDSATAAQRAATREIERCLAATGKLEIVLDTTEKENDTAAVFISKQVKKYIEQLNGELQKREYSLHSEIQQVADNAKDRVLRPVEDEMRALSDARMKTEALLLRERFTEEEFGSVVKNNDAALLHSARVSKHDCISVRYNTNADCPGNYGKVKTKIGGFFSKLFGR